MALNNTQIYELEHAIRNYSFPLDYYDYSLPHALNPRKANDVRHLESIIQTQLTSGLPAGIEQGLANIIYWGNASAGYRDSRFQRFRQGIKPFHPFSGFNQLLNAGIPSLGDIKRLGYSSYSGISFVSKILMFIDPQNYCVLDLRISKLKSAGRPISRALDQLKVYPTMIPITRNNEQAYDLWREECRYISRTYYAGAFRVADIERGFFELIEGNLAKAFAIYDNF